jgi:hypothetical protein
METALCQSCNKQRAILKRRSSRLEPGIQLVVCQSCIDSKFEPRWLIILHGRQHGPSAVADFITKRRYIGDEITAIELIVNQ